MALLLCPDHKREDQRKSFFSSKGFFFCVCLERKVTNQTSESGVWPQSTQMDFSCNWLRAAWTFTWGIVSAAGDPWKKRSGWVTRVKQREHIPPMRQLKLEGWGSLPFIQDRCQTRIVIVGIMDLLVFVCFENIGTDIRLDALEFSPCVRRASEVCVCDYANHLWLLTEPQIFPGVPRLIAVNLLSFLIKNQIKWIDAYLGNINTTCRPRCLYSNSANVPLIYPFLDLFLNVHCTLNKESY